MKKNFLTQSRKKLLTQSEKKLLTQSEKKLLDIHKVAGRSVSKALSGPQAQVVQQWVANRVRFDSIVEQMKQVAKEALEAASVLQQEREREAGQ